MKYTYFILNVLIHPESCVPLVFFNEFYFLRVLHRSSSIYHVIRMCVCWVYVLCMYNFFFGLSNIKPCVCVCVFWYVLCAVLALRGHVEDQSGTAGDVGCCCYDSSSAQAPTLALTVGNAEQDNPDQLP